MTTRTNGPDRDTDPASLAAVYAEAWLAHDWSRLRAILADDVTFRGPMGSADSADECIAGLRGLAATLERIDVHARVADGSDVITWFDLHSSVAPPTPTANWTHVENGKIAAIRVTFDPRDMLAGRDRAAGEQAEDR